MDPAKINSDAIFKSDFTITDYHIAAATPTVAALKADDSNLTEAASKSWIAVADKSVKECVVKFAVAAKNSNMVDCTNVDSHFYRNFVTDSATQDVQLSLEKAGEKT